MLCGKVSFQRIRMMPRGSTYVILDVHRGNRELGCHLCLLNHSAESDSCNVIFLLNCMTVQQSILPAKTMLLQEEPSKKKLKRHVIRQRGHC